MMKGTLNDGTTNDKTHDVRLWAQNISNEDDPDYDEDAAMCECGHSFRDHYGRVWNYSCATADCPCKMFKG